CQSSSVLSTCSPASFSLYSSCYHLDLHSFSTRRSSDLAVAHADRQHFLEVDPHLLELALQRYDRGQLARQAAGGDRAAQQPVAGDRKSTRLNSSHQIISYAVFCLNKKRNSQ